MCQAKSLVALQVCNGCTTGKYVNIAVGAFLVLMSMTAYKKICLVTSLHAHATREFDLLLLQGTYAPRGCDGHLVI